jgi:hypothetical protein
MRFWLLGLMLLPALALADYKSDYKDGVAAAERQEWAKADALIQRAMAEKPDPDPRANIRMYGQVYLPYLPQFYLGLSAFSRKDCAKATEWLSDPRIVAAARGLREENRRLMMLRTCATRLADAAPATPKPAPTSTPAAPSAAPTQPTSQPARPAAANASAAFDSSRAQALESRLARMGDKLKAAARGLSDTALATARVTWQRRNDSLEGEVNRAGARARSIRQARDNGALGGLERDLAALDARVDKFAADLGDAVSRGRGVALADARSQLQRGVDAGARALSANADGQAPAAQALRKALEQGRSLLSSGDAARIQTASAALEAALRQLETSQARRALAGQVRSRLGPLAAAWLQGDFAKVSSWTNESDLASVPAAHAEALLMRAAARYELYVLGGERDLALFEQVRTDLRAARRVSDQLQPSKNAYSPRFRALFASTR